MTAPSGLPRAAPRPRLLDRLPAPAALEPLGLERLRRQARSRLAELSWPTSQDEAWRHTGIEAVYEAAFEARPEPAACLRPRRVETTGALELDSVGGCVPAQARREPSGLYVGSLRAWLADQRGSAAEWFGQLAPWQSHPFACWNTAVFPDAVLVVVPPSCRLERPIHVRFVAPDGEGPQAVFPRLMVWAGANSEATVIESYVGAADEDRPYLSVAVAEVVVDEHAALEHVRVQWEGPEAIHLAVHQVRQARSSRYRHHNVSLGGRLARLDLGCRLEGEGAECTLNGLYLAAGRQVVDHHTLLDHASPHCPSHELYKGILSGRAQAIFHGRIIVRPGAQKTDAKQSNRNLLLSNEALVHTRPQLEIRADDVRCTHGATIGHLEEEALFYLRSRGLGAVEARALLIQGFAGEILEGVPDAALRAQLAAEVWRHTAQDAAER